MKVVFLTQYFDPEVGAAQTRLSAVTDAIAASGNDVEVVTALPNYPTGRIFHEYRGSILKSSTKGRVTIHRVWMFAAMGTGSRRLLSYLSFCATCCLGLMKVRRPSVIVIESPPLFLTITGIIYGKLRRIPRVVNVADLWPDAALSLGAVHEGRVLTLMYALERWAYRNATIVSTVTDGVKQRLLTEKQIPAEKVVMLPNGVDVGMFSPTAGQSDALERFGLGGRRVLIYAGTIGLAHGVDPLIDAMKLLEGRVSDPPVLLLLGSGSERDRLRSRVDVEGIDNVVFHDPVPLSDLASILPETSIGVVTLAPIPLNDACRPAKLYPLMASGLPVLFAGHGEGADIVASERCGEVVANDSEAIADAIERMLSDDSALTKQGDAGRSAAVEKWSWQAQTSEWLERVGRIAKVER